MTVFAPSNHTMIVSDYLSSGTVGPRHPIEVTVYAEETTTDGEPMPRTRQVTRALGAGTSVSVIATALLTFSGLTSAAFVSAIVAAGFGSLFSTAALRYYSRGRF